MSAPDTAAIDVPRMRAVNLAEYLRQTARRLPEHTAVVHGETRWTWARADDRVDALAAELRRRGVRAGQCVMLHSPNHPEFIQAMLAVWRIGAVLAPTNVRLTPSDVTVIARVCRPVAVIAHVDGTEHVSAVAELGELPAGTLWIGAHASDTHDSVAALPPATAAEPDAAVYTGDHAWYFFTSGTSGAPKAAILTHDQLGFVVTNHIADLMPCLSEHDASLTVAPLSHGAGVHLLPQLVRGATTVLTTAPGMDGDEVWALVEREQITNIFTVPTILKMLAEHPAVDKRDHSSLRQVIYAGAPMYAADQQHARSVLGDVLVQYYGLGEVTGNITVLPPHEHGREAPDGVEFGTCGRPRTGMQVVVLDADANPLPPGEVGEICVAGPAVCAGYLDNPDATAAAFADGWFHTGDLGMLDDNGYLYITGRASDMYISGGSNVHPRDIEEKLLDHPGIAEAAVLGMPHPKWGEVGVAVWVAADAAAPSDDELMAWLEPRLARYKLPRHLIRWDEIPKSGYGKIVKRSIREQLFAGGWEPEPSAR